MKTEEGLSGAEPAGCQEGKIQQVSGQKLQKGTQAGMNKGALWHTPLPAELRSREEGFKFKASHGQRVRPYLKQ